MDSGILSASPGKTRHAGRPGQAVASIYAQLSSEIDPLTLDLVPCGPEIITQLRKGADPSCETTEAYRVLENLENISEEAVKSNARTQKLVPLHVRRLYTDCRLLHSLLDLRDHAECDNEAVWLCAVKRLDMAIIISGAPGEGRLDLVLDTIELIQSHHLPLANSASESRFQMLETPTLSSLPAFIGSRPTNPIPRISPPSIFTFRDTFSSEPFILPRYVYDWPALNDHPWRSPAYLQRTAGRGRVVPVEVGPDYRAEDWDQRLMLWDDFLRGIGMNLDADYPIGTKIEAQRGNSRPRKEQLYLAQHSLLTQFPGLRSDIIVPDYVYASLPAPSTFPQYHPPGNEEQLVINAWLGPKGTVSPAHTDPYFNFYAQVVGRKTIWLASPRFQGEMYPFLDLHAPHTARKPSKGDSSQNTEVQNMEASLANTSRVDVFTPSHIQFPLFEERVQPHALCAVLEPGDMLYIPPGWWHAMRSEDISFSVSIWF